MKILYAQVQSHLRLSRTPTSSVAPSQNLLSDARLLHSLALGSGEPFLRLLLLNFCALVLYDLDLNAQDLVGCFLVCSVRL